MDKNILKKYQEHIYLDIEDLENKELSITCDDKVLIIEDQQTLYCYYNIKGFTPFNYKLYHKMYLSDDEFKKIKLSKFSKHHYVDNVLKKDGVIWHILDFQERSVIHCQDDLDVLKEELTLQNKKKKLLIHSCCGPCSSYCLEYLHDNFDITIFYSNSNIDTLQEFEKRVETQQQIIDELGFDIKLVVDKYQPKDYYKAVKGLEQLGEFSKRCYECYKFRLERCCEYAKENGFDYYTTTLSISPYKNSKWINEIGIELENKYDMKFLYSNFKAKDGYKKSVELSNKYHLYRQDYCGCIFSKEEMKKHEGSKN